jgi:hypothetical protein
MTDRPNNQDVGITESGHPSDDELSAYLNHDIADLAARQQLEAHLESCAECRDRLAELRTVVRLLRGFDHPVPQRSFRLDPSMVSPPLPESARIDPWIVRVQPALRRLTAIAAVLLVVLVTADVLTHRDSSENGARETSSLSAASQANDSTSVMSVGAAESVAESTAAAAQVPAAAAASSSGGGSSGSSGGAEAPTTSGAVEGSAAQSTASSSESTSASSASDAARPGEEIVPEASAAAVIIQPTEAAPTSDVAAQGGRSYWRLVELTVGVVVIWLLFLTVVLPRLPRQRRS